MSSKQKQLEEIKANIIKDKVCEDLAKQATQLVFGDGSPDSDLVFIGEAPGKNEDIQGKPFVGAAGKFLNEMLEMIGLSREDIYITNIVKYRPPNNRDPLPEEKLAFLPYLKKQLDVIKPKLIVTLGRHSMDSLLPGLKISQVHGQPKRIRIQTELTGGPGRKDEENPDVDRVQGAVEEQSEAYREYDEQAPETATKQRATSKTQSGGSADEQGLATWVILPLFHPAAALYNGAMRQTLIDDFARIPLILEKI